MAERSWSLTSEGILNSFFGSMGNLGMPSLETSELENFLKKIPSSANLAALPAAEAVDRCLNPSPIPAAGARSGGLPRVASLDFIRACLNTQNNDPAADTDPAAVATPDAAASAANAGHPFGSGAAAVVAKGAGAGLAALLPASGLVAANPLGTQALDPFALSSLDTALSQHQQQRLAAAMIHSQANPNLMLPYLAAMTSPFVAPAPASLPDSAAANGGASEQDGHRSGASSGPPRPHYSGEGDKNRSRKERRMLSNRESARRSRKRKQEHVCLLEQEIAGLAQQVEEGTAKIARLEDDLRASLEVVAALQVENGALRSQLAVTSAAGGGKANGNSSLDVEPLN